MTKKKSYRRYSPEFKREAIKRACEEGVTDAAVCKELGISTRQFRRWRDELHLMGEAYTNTTDFHPKSTASINGRLSINSASTQSSSPF
jgi:hypothetical protein